MGQLLVGIDVGTSRLKVGCFDTAGNLHSFAERPCATDHQGSKAVTLDAQTWWVALDEAMQECLENVPADHIRTVGVSSQAQSYAWLDNDGESIGRVVSWLDGRGDAESVERALEDFDFYAHTGWPSVDPMLAVCKLSAGIQCPADLNDSYTIVLADGYLMHRMTGNATVSRNLAAMSGLYSLQRDGWWTEALDCTPLERDNLPDIYEVGDAVGTLQTSVAQRWGMPPVPVVVGANDQTAAALGAGLAQPGETALCLGTAFVAYQVTDPNTPPPQSRPIRGPYAGPLHYQLAFHNTAGGVVEWAQKTICHADTWNEMFDMVCSAPPGAHGVRCCPDFSAANGGALSGLTLSHNQPDLLRAILEGVAMTAREKLQDLNAPEKVFATGGATANERWMQMMADVTHRSIVTLQQSQTTLWGTALAAGAGAGLFSDLLGVAKDTRKTEARYRPDSAHAPFYDEIFEERT